MQTGCENDFFDAVLFLEDSLVEKGRQVARKDVVKKAVSEGYELGYQKGFELGKELGYMQGCVQAWETLGCTPDQKARSQRAFAVLKNLLENFKLGNRPTLMEEFEKLRAKFKHVAVLMATGWQLDNPMAFSYQAKSKLSF